MPKALHTTAQASLRSSAPWVTIPSQPVTATRLNSLDRSVIVAQSLRPPAKRIHEFTVAEVLAFFQARAGLENACWRFVFYRKGH